MFRSYCCTKLLADACCSWFVPKLLAASFSFLFCFFSSSSQAFVLSQGQHCQADRLAHLLVLAFVVKAVVVACFG